VPSADQLDGFLVQLGALLKPTEVSGAPRRADWSTWTVDQRDAYFQLVQELPIQQQEHVPAAQRVDRIRGNLVRLFTSASRPAPELAGWVARWSHAQLAALAQLLEGRGAVAGPHCGRSVSNC
jgi:hypothetical protein